MTWRSRTLALSAWTSRAADCQAVPLLQAQVGRAENEVNTHEALPSAASHRDGPQPSAPQHDFFHTCAGSGAGDGAAAGRSMLAAAWDYSSESQPAGRLARPAVTDLAAEISTPSANAGSGLYPLVGQRKEHLAVVVGEGRIAGFVTRIDLVPLFRHGRTGFTHRHESATSERERDTSSPSRRALRNDTCALSTAKPDVLG